MSSSNGPNLVKSGLVLELDAGNIKSYTSGSITWYDKSGYNTNGTLTNGPTFNTGSGGSIVFDGVDDYTNIINPTSIKNQDLTISIWIKPSPPANSITGIADFDHASGQGWVIQSEDATSNRYYYFGYYMGSGYQPATGAGVGVQLTNSVWQNLVYTKNGTLVIGYLNGVQAFSATASSSNIVYSANKNLWLGGVVSIGGRFYNGNISQALIYNRGLSSTEVKQNFNALKSRFGLN